jgi:Transposase
MREILDGFHIVVKMNKALDEVRSGESRRMLVGNATKGRMRKSLPKLPLAR